MSKWRRFVSGIFCLTFLLIFFSGMGVSAETQQEKEWFKSWPTSAMFDKLWVDDVVCFSSQYYYTEEETASSGNTMTVISGEGVEIVEYEIDLGLIQRGMKFTKPGKVEVKVKETDRETDESREETFSFTVSERPADKPIKAAYSNAFGDVKLKIGERIADTAWKNFWPDDPHYGMSSDLEQRFSVTFHNAKYGLNGYIFGEEGRINTNFESLWYFGGGLGGSSSLGFVGDDRIAEPQLYTYHNLSFVGESYAFKPGTGSMDITYDKEKLGSLGTITVEEPIITSNAPANVKVGSTLDLTTALTNTALKNLKTAEYDDKKNYTEADYYNFEERGNNPIAYKPSVTVIEGIDCVDQSKQDYSNTLSSSETLTFKKTGTVKLKVQYTQFSTDPNLSFDLGWDETTNELIKVPNDKRYNPEKIITIQVTEDSKPTVTIIADEKTGIKLSASNGVVPPNTTLVVKPSNFVLKDAAGKYIAYDISLENGNAKIQPNGKVQISIPVPTGYDENRLTIYYIADNGTKTELPCTVKENLAIFETNHFSTYVLAEKAVTPQTSDTSNILLWWALLIIGGCGVTTTLAAKKRINKT